MTTRPISPECRRRPVRVAVALCIVMVAAVMMAGCTVDRSAGENSLPAMITPSYPATATTMPTPVPYIPSPGSATISRPELEIDGMKPLLEFWNTQMHWNLSPDQISRYAVAMENGVMKKYRTDPAYPGRLIIPDEEQFHQEAGEALGFTGSESEEFVRTLKQYRRGSWEILDCYDYANSSPCPKRTTTFNFSVKPNLQ